MADLSMCRDRKCPSRVQCVRYRAEPWVRQSYFAPPRMEAERCTYFIPVEGIGKFRLRDHYIVDLENDGEGP